MSRYLIAAMSAFLLLGLASAWNGRLMRRTLAQVESHVASANQQRMEIGKLNAGFTSTEGRPRTEDSVVASADKVAPWLVSGTPALAGSLTCSNVASVAMRSMWQMVSSHVFPGWIFPGQRAMNGTR